MLIWFKTLIRNSFFQVGVGILVMMVLAGFLLKLFESGEIIQGENPFWWAIVTMTTVGYGDFAPTTSAGRLFSIFVMFAGISLIAILTATISSIFVAQKIREGKGLEKISTSDHLVLCGWNKNGKKFIESIDHLTNGRLEIILVNDLSEEKITSLKSRFRNLKLGFVSGDFTKEKILDMASVRDAKTVIIVPNDIESTLGNPDDKTIFATMTVKGMDPNIRVVAYLMDKENLKHIKRANVDEIVVSDDFGVYMLASHVIDPGVPQTVANLLNEKSESRFKRHSIPEEFIGKPYSELFDHFRINFGWVLVGVFSIEENLGISSILSADSSSLDEFIENKLKEGGISLNEEEKVQTIINPSEEYLLKDGERAIVIS